MEIVLAKNAGFCFGVKRAIEEASALLANRKKRIYSIGSLIHNEHVINKLKENGLIEIDDINDIKNLKNETVIIRAHGIEKEIKELLIMNGNELIDLTCPFVSKIHQIVKNYSSDGYKVLVIGDKKHPEVRGIISYGKDIYVVINEEDINKLNIPINSKVLVVFQTTTNSTNAEKLVDILRKIYYNIEVVNTICNATKVRQEEVVSLAQVLDVMLIIGSATSSNTMKLLEIAKKYCDKSYLITDKSDLTNLNINKNEKVGVSAGASTPQYLVEEILTNVRNEF